MSNGNETGPESLEDVPWDSDALDHSQVAPVKRRKILSFLAAGASATALAGCSGGGGGDESDGGGGGYGGSTETPTSTEADSGGSADDKTETETEMGAKDQGKFVKTLSSEFTQWDPSITFDHSNRIHANVYEPLVWYSLDQGEVTPGLAKSYDVSDDGTVWTFNLREGVQFHGGYGELTAEDVKFTVNRMLELGKGPAYLWFPVDSIETPDDYTARFNLSNKIPLDLIASSPFGSWIYSKKGAQDVGDSFKEQTEWFRKGNDLGTGPYTVEDWQRSQSLTLSKFDDYWGGWDKPHFSTAEWQIVTESSTRVQMIRGGNADQVDRIPFSVLSSIQNDSGVEIYEENSFNQLIAQMNVRKAPTDDVNVRKAFLHSFPYEKGVEEIRKGFGSRNAVPVPNNMVGHNDELEPPAHDLDKAKSLIDQSGYTVDEINEASPFLTYSPAQQTHRRTALTLQSELKKIGVKLDVKKMSWSTMWSRAKKLETAPHVFLYLWWPTYASPYPNLWDLFSCVNVEKGETPIFQLTWWCNKEFDQMLNKGRQQMATNREQGIKTLKEAQKMVLDNALSFTFWDIVRIHPLRSEIKGYEPRPAYPNITFFYDLHK
ncbi:MAG: ABC transporter substrate-binding protein [Halobacteriales archaeon]|nr:ABC transporter substrate-binding protein [Halobacteriales archaeon]